MAFDGHLWANKLPITPMRYLFKLGITPIDWSFMACCVMVDVLAFLSLLGEGVTLILRFELFWLVLGLSEFKFWHSLFAGLRDLW